MNNLNLTWRDVFDPQMFKFAAGANIYDVNEYTQKMTNYKYFAFNGAIYESHQGYFNSTNLIIENLD